MQQSVAGSPFRAGVRTGLFGQHLTEQSQEQTEGMDVQLAEI